jgi:TatD DNase family protein
MLTETDAPFAHDGDEPLKPWQAFDALAPLAQVKGITREELQTVMMANLRKIGGLAT